MNPDRAMSRSFKNHAKTSKTVNPPGAMLEDLYIYNSAISITVL